MRPSVRALAATLALAVALLAGARGVALAHAALVRAEPAAGSRLAAGPARVRLVFSEPLEPGLARVSLAGPGGTTALAAAADPRDAYAVVAPVEDHLAPGAYRVGWRVVSADGHPVAGSVAFTVLGGPPAEGAAAGRAGSGTAAREGAGGGEAGRDTAAAGEPVGSGSDPEVWGPAAAGAPLVPAVLRGLALTALTALAGVLGFAVWPRGGPQPPRARRLVTALAVAAPLVLALHLAAWTANASPDHGLTGDGAAAVLASGAGRVELWRLGLAGLALWAVGLARRLGLGFAFACAALLVSGAAGHAAAVHPLVAVPTKALHVAAVAAWLGGLLWLLLAVRAPAPEADGALADGALAGAAARVSAVALVAAVLVTATGAVQTWLFLPSVGALAGSAYGRVALAKVAGLLGLLAFGAHHRYRALPRLASGAPLGPDAAFGTTLRRELALMIVVVLLSGLLAYVPTPAAPSAPGAAPTASLP